MKKKIIYGSLFAVVFTLSLLFKPKHDENLQQAEIDITILLTWIGDIEIGTQNCVCKGSTCSEANWISFRKACGDSVGWGGNTNTACSTQYAEYGSGQCN
jgi:hypothetical protein